MIKKSAVRDTRIAAILSYILVIFNTVFGLLVTPYILYTLGEIEYGVYKTIASLSSSITILDLGIGAMLTRYIARFKADKEDDRINGFISMAFGEGLILISFMSLVCIVGYFMIPTIYSSGLSSEEIALAKSLFAIMSCNICLNIAFHLISGIIQGYNKYSVSNFIQLLRLIIKIVVILLLLKWVPKAIVLCVLDLSLTVLVMTASIIYIRKKIDVRIRPSFKGWDKNLFLESFKYTGLLFLTSIAGQVNNNLDNVVVGAQLGAASVAVYSIGLAIFGMYESLSTAISGVMLPTVTNTLVNDEDGKAITHLIVKVGRIQFMLLGSAAAGFVAIGKRFIQLWVGDGFGDVYIITIILMFPAMLELCVNVCLSILRAQNRLGFRTTVLSISTLINAIITVIGVHFFGYYAAALGTAFSFLVGSVIIMNIYYYKCLNLNMLKIYKSIFGLSWICILSSAVVTRTVSAFLSNNWMSFGLCVCVYLIVFLLLMLAFGFNQEEKKAIKSMFIKRGKKNG